jgi:hypothetical protein
MKKNVCIVRIVVGLAIAGMSVAPEPAWAQAAPPLPPPPAPAPAPAAVLPVPPEPSPPPVTFAPAPAPTILREPLREPTREPTSEKDESAVLSDHDRFVKHLGFTYFDITSLPIANPLAAGTTGAQGLTPGGITSSTVAAPVVGVRYWLQRAIGIDVGMGLGFAGGSQEAVSGGIDTKVSKVGTGGFALHAGLPLVIYDGRHYAFLVIPEFTIGGASGKLTPTASSGGAEQDLSGFLFDGGAKVGAEIYFGFIGLPELALQATVGLSYRRSVFKLASAGNSASDGTNTFGTDVESDPWAIFTNNVSATYYF